jgi:hypothetical protein
MTQNTSEIKAVIINRPKNANSNKTKRRGSNQRQIPSVLNF